MIVVGGGASTRFGDDKLFADVAGQPLVVRSVEAVRHLVDRCVLVGRAESIDRLRALDINVEIVVGGSSRTLSEMAGLAALGGEHELVGIHDAARPFVHPDLVELLFQTAAVTGGAVPVLPPETILIDRRTLMPLQRAIRVQTPQVFRGAELIASFVRAAEAGFDGHDTVEIVHRFGDLEISGVPGDPVNVKVTYPQDLEDVRSRFGGSSRSEPQ